jgi:ferrous-iron efflux pump FieF
MIHRDELLAIGNARLRRLATYASIGVAVTLIVAKLAAYLMTDSVAMLSSLLDSTIDLLSAMVTAFGVANALRPPDQQHRFGHGKAEPLAALAQAAFIVGSSVLLGYEAISRFYHPHDIQQETLGYIVMGLAIILSIGLIEFQHLVVKRTSSMAIGADRMHYMGDVLINVAVVAAFALHQWTGFLWFDPLFAILVAASLSGMAVHIARHALDVLMDKELPEKDRVKIKEIVQSHPAVRGLHDMRTRSDSDRVFVELHVEMDADLPLNKAHEVSENIAIMVRKEFPDADVLIHQDPTGLHEDRLDEQIARRETA